MQDQDQQEKINLFNTFKENRRIRNPPKEVYQR